MAGNADNQHAPASNETNSGGSWGAAPPIMHSWCLQSDVPASGSVQTKRLDSKSRRTNDADDDCGFDLNLGLSLGGGKSSKPKGRKEKEVVLDRGSFGVREIFRAETGERRDAVVSKDVNGEEAFRGSVMFKPLKDEEDEANPNANQVQHSFWQDLDQAGSEAQQTTVDTSFSPRQARALISNQQAVEPSRWAGENSGAEDSNMFAQDMWQVLQGKAAQPEHDHQCVRLIAQEEASILINELQDLPPQAVATSAAWSHVVAKGGFPMQILEAIKDGENSGMSREMALQRSMSMSKSHLSGPHPEVIPAVSPPMSQQTTTPNADLERSDSDVSKNVQIGEEKHQQVAVIQQQEIGEQRRKREQQTQKRQEARRKRKALLEEQKSKKSLKKDEGRPGSDGSQGSRYGLDTPPFSLRRTSSLQPSSAISKENSVHMGLSLPDSQDAGGASSISAFRRPGSTSWLHNWDCINPQTAGMGAISVKAKLETNVRVDSGEQMVEIWLALDRARERDSKDTGEDSGVHVESNSEVRKMSSLDVVQMQKMDIDSNVGGRQVVNRQEGSNLGPPPGMVNGPIDPAWCQKIMEMQMILPNIPQMQRQCEGGAEMAASVVEIEKVGKKGRASCQTSSGGSESSDGQDEKSGNGLRVVRGDADAASSPAANSAGGERRPNLPNAMALSVCNAMAMANMAFLRGGAFSMTPGAFPFPLPVPPDGGQGRVPFSVPFPFPYLMQVTPSSATPGDENFVQRAHPTMPSPFQIALPAGFNTPFHMETSEGAAAWPSAAVRPHATSPQSPPRSAAAKLSQFGFSRDDDKHGPRGANGKEHARSQNTSPAGDLPAQPLVKTGLIGSGVFNRLRTTVVTANSSPLAPQFGISRSKADAVALRREGSVGSAFVAPGEQLPTPSASNGPINSLTESEPDGSTGVGMVPRPDPANSRGAADSGEDGETSASGALGILHQPEVAAAQCISREEGVIRLHSTGVWRQGSLPSFEGIARQEASSLRPGIAPGLHIGGTGTAPDLPWVTCNGTISGVLYRVEKAQVRIVCACHGRHMTPAEFVQHAGCGEILNPEKAIVVGPFTVMSQRAASAQA